MDMRLYAAIVSEESDLPQTYKLKGLGKALKQIERLEKLVASAWEAITTQRQAHPVTNYQCVFVAPEYFFSNQRYRNDRFFSHDVKRTIIQRLSTLAKRFPQLLIVPGTVLWTKDLYDKQLVSRGLFRKPKVVRTFNQARFDKAKARIEAAGSTHGTQTSLKGWSHTRDDQTREVKIAQNVAYLCLGATMLKYQKVGNYKEVENEKDELVFVPGSLIGRFTVGGVKYGLEVCMDHALGVFDSSVQSPDDKVHVQIVVSSFVSVKQNPNALVTVHSSTMKQTVYSGDKPGIAETTGTNPIRFGGEKVKDTGRGGRLASPPIKKPGFTLWPIDLTAPDIASPWDYTLRSDTLQSVSHIQ
jgi:predicted amidohydrolase